MYFEGARLPTVNAQVIGAGLLLNNRRQMHSPVRNATTEWVRPTGKPRLSQNAPVETRASASPKCRRVSPVRGLGHPAVSDSVGLGPKPLLNRLSGSTSCGWRTNRGRWQSHDATFESVAIQGVDRRVSQRDSIACPPLPRPLSERCRPPTTKRGTS